MTEFLNRVWIQSQEVNSRLPVFTEIPPGVSARRILRGPDPQIWELLIHWRI